MESLLKLPHGSLTQTLIISFVLRVTHGVSRETGAVRLRRDAAQAMQEGGTGDYISPRALGRDLLCAVGVREAGLNRPFFSGAQHPGTVPVSRER
ncbi:hypothetical protein GCM10008949_13670 [Deinococcus humi]|nr:hypothetical protein GCM10008949_13670 [Deinococcus humi]